MSSAPFQVVAGPYELYIAPVGESFPAIDAEPPGGNWVLIGTSGDDSYSEDGVTIQATETVEDFRTLGSTGPVKAFRTEEDVIIGVMLHDMTLEALSNAWNFNTVSVDTDDKTMNLSKGLEVSYRALLVRGNDKSPYATGNNMQWEIPRVRISSEPEVVFTKGEPAGVAIEFKSMKDLSASSDAEQFGRTRTQFQN